MSSISFKGIKALSSLTLVFFGAVGCTHVADEVAHSTEDVAVSLLSTATTDILAQINAPIQVYEGIFSFYQETGRLPLTAEELNLHIKKEKEDEVVATITNIEEMEIIDQVVTGKVSYMTTSKFITEETQEILDVELDLNIDESELTISYSENTQTLVNMLELFKKMGEP